MVEVTLDTMQMTAGVGHAAQRRIRAIKRGTAGRYGISTQDAWSIEINGVLGEMAVAKYLKGYMSFDGGIGDPDITVDGTRVEVRTSMRDGGHLLLHPGDYDDAKYYLVFANGSDTFKVAGWVWGKEGKNPKFWRDHAGNGRPCYWVPAKELHQC